MPKGDSAFRSMSMKIRFRGRSRRLPEEDGDRPEVEVDEVLRLYRVNASVSGAISNEGDEEQTMCDETTETATTTHSSANHSGLMKRFDGGKETCTHFLPTTQCQVVPNSRSNSFLIYIAASFSTLYFSNPAEAVSTAACCMSSDTETAGCQRPRAGLGEK